MTLVVVLVANHAYAGKMIKRFGVDCLELGPGDSKLIIPGYDFAKKNQDFPVEASGRNTLLAVLPINEVGNDFKNLSVFQSKREFRPLDIWEFEGGARFMLFWFDPGFDRYLPFKIVLETGGKKDINDLGDKEVKQLAGSSKKFGPVLPPKVDDPLNKALTMVNTEHREKVFETYRKDGLLGLGDIAVKSVESGDQLMALAATHAILSWMTITRPEPDEDLTFKSWKIMGFAFMKLGEDDAAHKAFNEALKINKKDEQILEALKKLKSPINGEGAKPPVLSKSQTEKYKVGSLPGVNEIREGLGANGIILGIGKEAVISTCGQPEDESGFRLKFGPDSICTGFVLLSPSGKTVEITSYKGKTSKGIQNGASIKSLKSAYGSLPMTFSEPLPGIAKNPPKMKRYRYVELGISFQDVDDDGKIDSITVFPASGK